MIKYQQILHAQALLIHQSFRQAAKAEHITQPAFSRSIANLETTLEVELFNRHRGRVTPTILTRQKNTTQKCSNMLY